MTFINNSAELIRQQLCSVIKVDIDMSHAQLLDQVRHLTELLRVVDD